MVCAGQWDSTGFYQVVILQVLRSMRWEQGAKFRNYSLGVPIAHVAFCFCYETILGLWMCFGYSGAFLKMLTARLTQTPSVGIHVPEL